MKCRFKKCDGSGQIPLGNFQYDLCPCAHYYKAEERYKQSGADKRHMKFASQLSPSTVKDMNKKDLSIIELLKSHRDYDNAIHNQSHIVLFGKLGTGKTQIASTLMLNGAFYGHSCLFIDCRDLEDIARTPERSQHLKESIKKTDIIVLDDLGVEASTGSFYNLAIINLLDSIIRKHKGLLIVTTNKAATEESLIATYPNGHRHIDELLKKGTAKYYFGGQNMRKEDKA